MGHCRPRWRAEPRRSRGLRADHGHAARGAGAGLLPCVGSFRSQGSAKALQGCVRTRVSAPQCVLGAACPHTRYAMSLLLPLPRIPHSCAWGLPTPSLGSSIRACEHQRPLGAGLDLKPLWSSLISPCDLRLWCISSLVPNNLETLDPMFLKGE